MGLFDNVVEETPVPIRPLEPVAQDPVAKPITAADINCATQVRNCRGCGSHFSCDTEEQYCPRCIEWHEAMGTHQVHRDALRKGGR